MLEPIAQDIEPFWKKVREQKNVEPHHPAGHEHGYCVLGEFLTTLTIASKYEAEADVNLKVVLEAINRLRRQIHSPESRALLSRIDGIVQCYTIAAQIPTIIPRNQSTPTDLLKDLLDDARMISLSKSRYLLGVPGKFEIAMIIIKRKVRTLLSEPKSRRNLGMACKIGNIATRRVNLEFPEIDSQKEKIFSPPLMAVDDIKPNCLSTNRDFFEGF